MKNRNIICIILLFIFTFGLYGIYWTYVTADALNEEELGDKLMNYIVAILLSLITFGIYGIYWAYKFYRKADRVLGTNNFLVSFLLHLFGFSIVSAAITQNEMNKEY